MAFFSSSAAYDGAQLRRKRSLSREQPSLGDHPSDESSPRKRSPSASVAPAAESSEIRPPLPTPVSAGLSRPRSSARPQEQPVQQSPYEQSSTPIPFTKPVKRNSPPPFSNLIIDVSKSTSRASPQSTNERTKRSEKKLLSSAQPEASSSSALRTMPRLDNEHPVTVQGVKPSNSQKNIFSNFTRSKSHSPTRPRSAGHASSSTFKRTTHIEGAPSKNFGVLDVLPGNMPPSPPSDSHTRNTASLLTPVSPHQFRSTTRAQSDTKHVEHSRSCSNPQSPSFPSPAPDTRRAKRVPAPQLEHQNTQSPPPPVLSSSSGTSTPTHDAAKKQEKRSRNVLRKPSLSKREPTSAPSSDSERQSKTHRPHPRSGVFAAIRRNSSAGLFDFIHPPPAATNLTPAGEILVAYKESQRDPPLNGSRTTSFGKSGKLVAVGAPDDEVKSPWTPGWRSVPFHDGDADDGEKKGLKHSLSRKLSERWGGKDMEHPRSLVNARQSASGGVAEFPQDVRRSTKRPTSSRKESKAHRSPKSAIEPNFKHHGGWPKMEDEGEGHVWEEDVGDFAFSHSRSKETSESSSPGRLWKLVKRFSSGNLKDKSSPPLNPPPPVPPLPKELTFASQTSPNDAAGSPDPGEISISQVAALEIPGGIMGYTTSMPSPSVPQTKNIHPRSTSAHSWAILGFNTPAAPSTSDVSTHASHRTGTPRRSTTTRSSSPSSENTRLFSRSRTSSDSSYGEIMPPMPKTYVHQHIVPPHELYRLVNSKEGDTTTTSQPPSSAQKLTASATPGSPSSSSGSTTIPNFDVKNVSNAFIQYKNVQSPNSSTAPTTHFPEPEPPTPLGDQAPESHPPPIPSRNPRRPSSLSGPSFAMLAGQQSLLNVIPVQESSESETTDIEVSPRRAKARPRSISDGAVISEPVKSPSTARSPMTFREMTITKRPLTEQEKNAKWEDLLKRSAMAGGTLHVGSHSAGGLALWSDRASLAPSETLDRF